MADSKPVKTKPRKRGGPFSWLIALAVIAAYIFFLREVIAIDILPVNLLLALIILSVLITLFLLLLWLFKPRHMSSRMILGLLALLLGSTYCVGGYFIRDASDMFNAVSNLTDKVVNVVTVYGMIDNGINTPADLNGKVVGTITAMDQQGTEGALQKLRDDGVDFTTQEYENQYVLVDALYNHEVDAIAFPENYHDDINEIANDDNKYNALTTFTNNIEEFIYYTERDESTINPADPVANVMTDPFVVLISGNDSYGSLSDKSRSDVNMVVAVNPSTAQIMMVSIPRDTYLETSCKKNETACANVAGMKDKLTHSGLYGIGTTESTIEDFLGIPINYTVRVNFSSLINLVDAIGGIDVNVEPGLEVERFYSNGTEGVHEGVNHLDGERALAFSRERYAYIDGDNQRVRNQQIVMKALIQAMMSPAMVVNYPKVMDALSIAFETNMTAKEMKSLLTLELAKFPKWNIQSYSLTNDAGSEYSPGVGNYASVSYADAGQAEYASSLLKDVLEGRVPDLSNADSARSGIHYEGSTESSGNEYDYDYGYQDPYGTEDYGQGDQDYYGQDYGYDAVEQNIQDSYNDANRFDYEDFNAEYDPGTGQYQESYGEGMYYR